MKKILYLVSTLASSGPTNQLSYIVKYLDRSIFEPIILTLSHEPEASSINYFQNVLGVRVESLGLSRMRGMLSGSAKVKQYIMNNNIDLIHTQGIRADSLIKRIDVPQVSTLRAYPFNDYLTKFGKLKGTLMAFSHMRIIKSNRHNCIACSKSIAEEFQTDDLRLNYIQNGVDTDKYFPLLKKDKKALKNKLAIDTKKIIFITVGSLIPRKDVQTVISGFNLYKNNNNSILLIAGVGFEKDKLQSISDENVKFLGNISNVVEYLQISDCFVSASLAEGLPNTVLEAMACGLPVILSNIAPHRELCNDQSSFFGIHDALDLSIKLACVNDFTNNTKEIVDEIFSAEIMSKKYQKLYLERMK